MSPALKSTSGRSDDVLSEEAVDEALDDDEEEAAPLHPAIRPAHSARTIDKLNNFFIYCLPIAFPCIFI